MSIRLRSEIDYNQTLALNSKAWQSILAMAGKYGWSPMGTIRPETLTGLSILGVEENSEEHNRLVSSLAVGGYSPHSPDLDRLVLLEDALNLADALERAFLTHSAPTNPRGIVFLSEWEAGIDDSRPGVGVMLALVELCRHGAFWIEKI